MKKILIVNNNLKVGGVQKSLVNLVWSIYDRYDVTVLLFSKTGEYVDQLPASVKVMSCRSLFRYLGVSQGDCKESVANTLVRGFLAVLCKAFGRACVLRIVGLSQQKLPEDYDVAVSYLHNGNPKSFYGGVNEFVLRKVRARRKVAFLHCDYAECGANYPSNNRLYARFDVVAACSDGCRASFVRTLPEFADKCITVKNFHRWCEIESLAADAPMVYESGMCHALVVGRLAHEKAVDRAIRAVAHARALGMPVCLHIVGDGGEMGRLQQLACSLGAQSDVLFYGEQRNPYRFMTNADLLLVTSYHEAAPMVIDEACALGLPVLTVETTSSKEMVADRRCGWVCENSQEGLNEQLVKVLRNPSMLADVRVSLEGLPATNDEAAEQFALLVG